MRWHIAYEPLWLCIYGVQAGCEFLPGPEVRAIWLVPSAFMTKTSLSRVKAILPPSRDHDGPLSPSALLPLRSTGLDPSAFITNTSELLAREVVNANFVPSGEHEPGSSLVEVVLRLTWLEPSETISYISSLPSRVGRKAILVPSGDQVGLPSIAALLVRFT